MGCAPSTPKKIQEEAEEETVVFFSPVMPAFTSSEGSVSPAPKRVSFGTIPDVPPPKPSLMILQNMDSAPGLIEDSQDVIRDDRWTVVPVCDRIVASSKAKVCTVRARLPSKYTVNRMTSLFFYMDEGDCQVRKTCYTPISPLVSAFRCDEDLQVLVQAKQNQSDDDISSFLIDCPLDSKVEVKGPEILFPLRDIHNARSIFLLSGGSGISPMLQLLDYCKKSSFGGTLYFAHSSATLAEFPLFAAVEKLPEALPNLRTLHTLTRETPPPDWKGESGRLNIQKLLRFVPKPYPDTLCFICGPPGFKTDLNATVKGLGVKPENIVLFG
eukprot:CAMPEP_0113877400 /NCGR_PEP_ID=MMETSP0780_2-20120614/6073_1 /TAXON_ID=652834 /ORGANISM="Palpitomonas bilix" /LENGTH=326 /DNA_ID=CAMNT_0000863689 /DNA_START=497 /DNA_END=1481 /DNA_ORIENTATION=+ /assembly_acc=CAM_ASM_000599